MDAPRGPERRALDTTEIDHNSRVLTKLTGLAERRMRQRRMQSALEWCRVAASFAMTNSFGDLRSVALERVIDEVAAAALPQSTAHTPNRSSSKRVLHVVTEAADIGGLTRLVERWIERDRGTTSSVAITRQDRVAPVLADAARSAGGGAVALGADGPDSIQRAAHLRRLAGDADFVICHLHSDDVVAAVAFGAGYDGAPVALYNHADHLFWLVPSRAVAVIDARKVGGELTRSARGIDRSQALELALPIPPHVPATAHQTVALDLPQSAIVAISVARPVKFQSTLLQPHFSDLIAEALLDNPRLVCVAVGPDAGEEPWPHLASRFKDRVIPIGPVRDPSPYLAVADIYLDPFPFSSTTSLLEAAAVGLPTVTLDIHRGYRRALGLADFIEEAANRPTTVGQYQSRLKTLVDSQVVRQQSGARARHGYIQLTSELSWRQQLSSVYSELESLSSRHAVLGATYDQRSPVEMRDYSIALLAIEQRIPLQWTLAGSKPRLDKADRAFRSSRSLMWRAMRRFVPWFKGVARMADHILIPSGRIPMPGWSLLHANSRYESGRDANGSGLLSPEVGQA